MFIDLQNRALLSAYNNCINYFFWLYLNLNTQILSSSYHYFLLHCQPKHIISYYNSCIITLYDTDSPHRLSAFITLVSCIITLSHSFSQHTMLAHKSTQNVSCHHSCINTLSLSFLSVWTDCQLLLSLYYYFLSYCQPTLFIIIFVSLILYHYSFSIC